MTQEEKAKRYDEAIERAKAYQGLRSEMEIIFPELKESEGKRIRDWLIAYLENRVLNTSIIQEKENCKKAIAWLEKQGEQKESYDTCDSSMLDNKKSPYGEKRDFGYFEEKPAEEITSNPDYISPKDKALFEIATVLSQHEDKDGSPLEEIRSILVNLGINNLESNEKNPTWSEEDEKQLNDILMCGERHCYLDAGNIAWLKSLRPQNTWKPSDEQMKGIEYAIKTLRHQLCIGDERLNSLYDCLKKLRKK